MRPSRVTDQWSSQRRCKPASHPVGNPASPLLDTRYSMESMWFSCAATAAEVGVASKSSTSSIVRSKGGGASGLSSYDTTTVAYLHISAYSDKVA